jgi:hypothetical protein
MSGPPSTSAIAAKTEASLSPIGQLAMIPGMVLLSRHSPNARPKAIWLEH